MGTVSFRRRLGEERIEVGRSGLSDGHWAELTAILLAAGAVVDGSVLVLTALGVRRAALDLASAIHRQEVDVESDPLVNELLEQHFAECEARKAAESDASALLKPELVTSRVRASGRFTRALTTNQLRDLGRLLHLRHGANFSVPGAGKTATTLAAYEALRANEAVDRLLVVAPKNAFLSWEEEVLRCFKTGAAPTVGRIAGGREKALESLSTDKEIFLVTYQFLPRVVSEVATWAAAHRTHVVLDESHRVKAGSDGLFSGTALQLSGVAARRDILSGTPLPNSPEDLRSQVEFVWPGQRIMPEANLRTDNSKALLEDIQRTVGPLYVRTTKKELKLPEFTLTPVQVELGPLQRELYELMRSEARRVASGISAKDRKLLRELGRRVVRMLQAATNPMLLVNDDEVGDELNDAKIWELLREIARTERPAKISKAVEIAERVVKGGKKVLIWTSFVRNILLLERTLAEHGAVTLYGAIGTGSDEDEDTREGRIRRFHEDDSCRVMIANPAACGEGISLHQACHHAVYLDRTFNAAHYLQSVDRIHRLGLGPDVVTNIDILEARWTIDTRVARRLKLKIDSMQVVLNDPGLAALAYDPEDVTDEFPAGIEAGDVDEIIEHVIRGDRDEGK